MVSDDPGTRQLVRRAIGCATPAPGPDFERAALAAIRRTGVEPPVRKRHPDRLVVVIATLALGAMAATAMAYPPARDAASRLPALGVLGSLYGGTRAQPAALAEATSSGYTLRVTSGYDDGTTVVLAFDLTPAGRPTPSYDIGWGDTPTVTDSSGLPLDSSFTPIGPALSSSLAFDRPSHGSPAGSPLSVDVTRINLLDRRFPGGFRTVSGHWALGLSIRPSAPARPLPVPPAGPLDGGTVTFDAVSANDAYLAVRYTLIGVTPPPGLPAGKGWSPAVLVYGPDGRRLTMLSWGTSSDSPTTFVWKGQLAASTGTYRIVFADADVPLLERTIAVPNGRSAAVPAVP
jgi:hypothetical protein